MTAAPDLPLKLLDEHHVFRLVEPSHLEFFFSLQVFSVLQVHPITERSRDERYQQFSHCMVSKSVRPCPASCHFQEHGETLTSNLRLDMPPLIFATALRKMAS